MRRRLTVQFGSTRVAVPCGDGRATLAEIAAAAVQRYKTATGKGEDTVVRVVRLVLPEEDDAILDMADTVEEILEEGATNIVAIFDEGDDAEEAARHRRKASSSGRSSGGGGGGGVVEVSDYERLPMGDLRVSSSASSSSSSHHQQQPPPPLPSSSHHQHPLNNHHHHLPSSSSSNSFLHSPYSSNSAGTTASSTPVRSSLRSEGVTSPTRNHRVTLSPEVTKKLDFDERREFGSGAGGGERERERERERESRAESRLTRSIGRKSKISDAFYDAAARLEESAAAASCSSPLSSQQLQPSHSMPVGLGAAAAGCSTPLAAAHSKSDAYSASAILPNGDPTQTIIVLHDRQKTRLGIEVMGVQDEAAIGKLAALQITSIDADGRVGRDGGLRIGDNVVELNGRPVHQMSLIRARTYLYELATESSPTLTIARPISSFQLPADGPSSSSSATPAAAAMSTPSSLSREGGAQGSMKKPIQSALQQANTAEAHGEQLSIAVVKRNGFGFTITGRETGAGAHLFYVGTVKSGGAAYGLLQGGDRLMEVNGESLEALSQSELVERLKRVREGDRVQLAISRVVAAAAAAGDEAAAGTPAAAAGAAGDEHRDDKENRAYAVDAGWEELLISIPLNNSGSAGLGVSLKARVTVKNDRSRHDCGIFVKKLLHGGAAHRDGRLRVDDRLVAIEEECLRTRTNAEASEAITTKLKNIGQEASAVTLKIWRPRGENGEKGTGGEAAALLDESIHVNGGAGTPIASTPTHVKLRQLSVDERRATISSECSTGTDLDESTIASGDAFDREAPSRKSISEKRGMGASSDAALTTTFQKIKHGRQTSAPPTSASFHGASAVAKRTAERIRSQSVHPRVPAGEEVEEDAEDAEEREGEQRRETRGRSSTVGTPQSEGSAAAAAAAGAAGGGGERASRASNGVKQSFKQAVDDTNLPWMYRSSTDSPLVMRRTAPNEHKEKDKERRKSMGSGLRSLFKLGKSRETLEMDKAAEEHARQRRDEELRRRMEEDFRAAAASGLSYQQQPLYHSRTTPTSMRRTTVYSEYPPPPPHLQYPPPYRDEPPPPLSSPLRSPLIVANSKFYSSHSRDPRALSTIITHTSSIDTRAIDTGAELAGGVCSTRGQGSSSSSSTIPRPSLITIPTPLPPPSCPSAPLAPYPYPSSRTGTVAAGGAGQGAGPTIHTPTTSSSSSSRASTTRHSMPGSRTLAGQQAERAAAPAPPPFLPTTRFPMYVGGSGGGGGGGYAGTAPRAQQRERLSLRARKKMREARGVGDEPAPAAPPPAATSPYPPPPAGAEIPLIRMRREPVVYAGGSLPARNLVHPLSRPPLLSADLYASPSPPPLLISRL